MLGRVFGNIYDFGAIFARAGVESSPNIYGPITLIFGPQVFTRMDDVVITRTTVAELADPWRQHDLTDDDVDELLVGDAYGSPVSSEYQFCEISCGDAELPLDHLEMVLVEPIILGDHSLVALVQELVEAEGIDCVVIERVYRNEEHRARLQELAGGLWEFEHDDVRPERVTFDEIPDWIERMDQRYHRRFETWATYFYNGTVQYLRGH